MLELNIVTYVIVVIGKDTPLSQLFKEIKQVIWILRATRGLAVSKGLVFGMVGHMLRCLWISLFIDFSGAIHPSFPSAQPAHHQAGRSEVKEGRYLNKED